jgi:hypothetical protein
MSWPMLLIDSPGDSPGTSPKSEELMIEETRPQAHC